MTIADLQRIAAAGGAWRETVEEVTATVDAARLARIADCLDGPPAGPLVPSMWLDAICVAWPDSAVLGGDGHPADGLGYPPLVDRRRVFAGARLRVNAPARVGDTVTRTTRVVNVRASEGRTGPMLFVTIEHADRVAGGAVIAREEHDLAYRSGPAAQPPSVAPAVVAPRVAAARVAAAGVAAPQVAGPHVAAAGAGSRSVPGRGVSEELTLVADTTRLFRFSALTANSHRIHYDEPYATAVEGLPGLLVHGPLLGMVLLELPRRLAADRVVHSFEFRVRRPALAGAHLLARVAGRNAESWEVTLEADGVTVATGTVGFG